MQMKIENFGAQNFPILGAIELKFGRHVFWANGSRHTKFGDDGLKFSYTFPLNPTFWGPLISHLTHDGVWGDEGLCQKSARSIQPFDHNSWLSQTDRRTDRRLDDNSGLDRYIGRPKSNKT